MKYSGSLVKKEREQIFRLFLENIRLKFSEIEKALNIKSNMVSYHLERMQKEELIEKREAYYFLTKRAEKYLPIIPHIVGEKLSPLPVILIALLNEDSILLMKRNRRPYKDYWALIGGKMLLEESFEEASKRLIKEKTSFDAKFVSINSVIHERVEGEGLIKHSFILFFTKMMVKETEFKNTGHGKLKWFKLSKIRKKEIIPSDFWLVKNKLNSKIEVKDAYMAENQGKLSSFRILK